MTDTELDAIEARANAATQGPWTIECRSVANPDNDPGWDEEDFLQFHLHGPRRPTGRGTYYGRDADFIARARADVPALIAEIRRLRG